MKKKRFKVSSDQGKTWKSCWINRHDFDPALSPLKQGEWNDTNQGIRLVCIIHGKLDATEAVVTP